MFVDTESYGKRLEVSTMAGNNQYLYKDYWQRVLYMASKQGQSEFDIEDLTFAGIIIIIIMKPNVSEQRSR